jgi:predicted DNA-binding transcriptional regulator AlpA
MTEVMRLVDKEQVARSLGVRRTQVGEMLASPGFPPAVGYFRGRHVWDEDAVQSWIDAANQPRAEAERLTA